MIDDGYIKFDIHLTDGQEPKHPLLNQLNLVRIKLYDLGLIGVYENGIGYGNISIRGEDLDTFIISGTGTGSIRKLSSDHYCQIDSFDIETNKVYCTGPVQASSESMSHGIIYQALLSANCVIHIHSRRLFDYMLANDYSKTSKLAAFGTPKIASEINELVVNEKRESGIFVTSGHDEGIIAYGSDIDSVFSIVSDVHKKLDR